MCTPVFFFFFLLYFLGMRYFRGFFSAFCMLLVQHFCVCVCLSVSFSIQYFPKSQNLYGILPHRIKNTVHLCGKKKHWCTRLSYCILSFLILGALFQIAKYGTKSGSAKPSRKCVPSRLALTFTWMFAVKHMRFVRVVGLCKVVSWVLWDWG